VCLHSSKQERYVRIHTAHMAHLVLVFAEEDLSARPEEGERLNVQVHRIDRGETIHDKAVLCELLFYTGKLDPGGDGMRTARAAV
jgi:hypothetical protein